MLLGKSFHNLGPATPNDLSANVLFPSNGTFNFFIAHLILGSFYMVEVFVSFVSMLVLGHLIICTLNTIF